MTPENLNALSTTSDPDGSVAFVIATRKMQELLRRRDIYEEDKLAEAFQIGREYEQSVQGND